MCVCVYKNVDICIHALAVYLRSFVFARCSMRSECGVHHARITQLRFPGGAMKSCKIPQRSSVRSRSKRYRCSILNVKYSVTGVG